MGERNTMLEKAAKVQARGNRICFGRYALQALEPAWITSRQIEVGFRAMTRNVRRGSPEYLVAVIKPGRILYEMSGVAECRVVAGCLGSDSEKLIHSITTMGFNVSSTVRCVWRCAREFFLRYVPSIREVPVLEPGLMIWGLPNKLTG
ncbi:hypothetical protein GQ457_02G042930 [Hibiscus cannabinus]